MVRHPHEDHPLRRGRGGGVRARHEAARTVDQRDPIPPRGVGPLRGRIDGGGNNRDSSGRVRQVGRYNVGRRVRRLRSGRADPEFPRWRGLLGRGGSRPVPTSRRGDQSNPLDRLPQRRPRFRLPLPLAAISRRHPPAHDGARDGDRDPYRHPRGLRSHVLHRVDAACGRGQYPPPPHHVRQRATAGDFRR